MVTDPKETRLFDWRVKAERLLDELVELEDEVAEYRGPYEHSKERWTTHEMVRGAVARLRRVCLDLEALTERKQ